MHDNILLSNFRVRTSIVWLTNITNNYTICMPFASVRQTHHQYSLIYFSA